MDFRAAFDSLESSTREQERVECAKLVLSTSINHADGYRRAVNQFSTDAEKDIAEKCACAASNTGWFILNAMGFKGEKLEALKKSIPDLYAGRE